MIETPITIPEGSIITQNSDLIQIPQVAESREALSGTRAVALRVSLKDLPIYAKGNTQVPDAEMARVFYEEEYGDSLPEITHITQVLPEFQTLHWEEDIKPYAPSDEMFLDQDPYHLESIHSRRHMLRVIANSRIRAEMMSLTDSEKKVISVAAGYHDTARINDRWDQDHGKRAAENFVKRQHYLLFEQRGIQLSPEEVEAVQVLCHYHEIPWEKISVEVKEQYGLMLEALTDGDKADRCRSPDRFWWPKPEFMSPSLRSNSKNLKTFMAFTRYFTLSNELSKFKNNLSIEKAFMQTCIATGIVKEPERTSPTGVVVFSQKNHEAQLLPA